MSSTLLTLLVCVFALGGCEEMMSGRPWMIECAKTCRGRVQSVTGTECHCMPEPAPCAEVKR